jgi:hypothetical protein
LIGISSTSAGIEIDVSDEHIRNAQFPIRVSLEPGSNITCDGEVHSAKQLSPRRSTDAGIEIDFRLECFSKGNGAISINLKSVSRTIFE